MYKEYHIAVGPFIFSVSSNLYKLHKYLENHYAHQLLNINGEHFVDYYIEVIHGSWFRRLYKPQVIFKFNHHSPFKPLPVDQAEPLLEWGMNWVIATQAHQYFMLHAATVSKNGKGIIISAPSGSGKSTLCAYLVSQGWELLSDELALMDLSSKQLHGLGRPIHLKNKSIELLQEYFVDEQFSDVIENTRKGAISLLKPPVSTPASIQITEAAHIFFVKYTPDEDCYAEPIEPALALTEVIRNSFNFNILNKTGFNYARNLVSHTPATYIEYSNLQSCEQAIVEAINNREKDTITYAY